MSYPSGAWGFTSPGEIVANKVVIFGPNDGWFIYDGTPGPGNPPVAFGTAQGTTKDPYGNTLPGLPSSQGSVAVVGPGEVAQLADGALFMQASGGGSGAQPVSMSTDGIPGFLELFSGSQSSTDTGSEAILNSGALGGTLQVQSGADGNVYDTMHLTAETTGTQGINSEVQANITGLSIPVAKGMTYDFEAEICFVGNAGNDAYLTMAGPAASSFIATIDYGENTGNVVQQTVLSSNTGCNSEPLTAGFVYRCRIWGRVTFTASGNMTVNGAASANALTFTTQIGSIFTIRPVSGVAGSGAPAVPTGKLRYLLPSGDTTGVTDANTIMACYNAGLIPWLTPGDYYWAAGVVVITTPGFYIWGSGQWATTIHGVGTGTLLRMYWTQQYIPHSQNQAGGGIKGGVMFDLNSMTAPSTAIHAGDIYNLEWECGVRYGPGPIAVWYDNNYHWTEQMRGRVWVENNVGINVAFDNSANLSGAATGSFDRLGMRIDINQNGLGHGVVFQNGANVIDGPGPEIYGNFTGGAALWYVLKLIGSNTAGFSLLADCGLNIGVELDTLVGTVPGTIDFDSQSNNVIDDCTGIIDFGAADQFAGANNAQGSFKFDGPVYGDGFLQGSGPLYGEAFKFSGSGGGGNLANGNEITTRFFGIVEVTTSANVTGIILQGFNPEDWRTIQVMNNGTGTITFAAAGTSHVANGVSAVIQPNSVCDFVWNPDLVLWFQKS